MRIPERDVIYIVLSVYLLTITKSIRHKIDHTKVNLIERKIFELELDFAEYIQYTDVRIVDLCRAPYTIYLATSYLQLLALFILTCSYYEFPISTRFRQFQKFGKNELGALSFSATPKEQISARILEFLFIATCALDLTFLAPLTSGI